MLTTLVDDLRASFSSRTQRYPLVGQLPQILVDPLRCVASAARARPGEVAVLRVGPYPIYVVSHPDHVQRVLTDSGRIFSKRGSMWEPLRRLFGAGILTSNGEPWLKSRRMTQPLFASRNLAALAEIMIDVVEESAEALEPPAARGVEVDMSAEMMRLTQRILVKTLFDTSALPGKSDEISDAILEAFRILSVRLFLFFLPSWVPMPGEAALARAIRTIDDGILRLLREHRARTGGRPDLLSLLLGAVDVETQERMTDRQIRDELVTLLIAGTETTANTMTWLWYLLDRHPDVERRLRAEHAEVFGAARTTLPDLERLTYTKQVIQETLRLYPPGWMLPRAVHEEVTFGDTRIPEGSTVLVCPYATHHDPTLWKDPERFDPERFSPDESASRPRYAYYPFGGGPRQCIGNQFAILEAQIIVAALARRFRFQLVPGRPVEPGVATTLKPRHGVQMYIRATA